MYAPYPRTDTIQLIFFLLFQLTDTNVFLSQSHQSQEQDISVQTPVGIQVRDKLKPQSEPPRHTSPITLLPVPPPHLCLRKPSLGPSSWMIWLMGW